MGRKLAIAIATIIILFILLCIFMPSFLNHVTTLGTSQTNRVVGWLRATPFWSPLYETAVKYGSVAALSGAAVNYIRKKLHERAKRLWQHTEEMVRKSQLEALETKLTSECEQKMRKLERSLLVQQEMSKQLLEENMMLKRRSR